MIHGLRRRYRNSVEWGWLPSSGGHKPAVRIQANPVALAAYGISLEQLRTALTQTSVNAAKGGTSTDRDRISKSTRMTNW